jgi:hypothetical protein
MLINIIILATTALVAAFVLVWLFVPGLRKAIEAPKFDVADWDR